MSLVLDCGYKGYDNKITTSYMVDVLFTKVITFEKIVNQIKYK